MQSATVERMDYQRERISLWKTHPYRLGAAQKEPWTVAYIEQLPEGAVFHDIGANVGPYTLIAAKLGHPVIAIEPAYANYADLVKNAILNAVNERVISIPLALGSQNGLEWLQLSSTQSGAASHILGQPTQAGGRAVFLHRVPVMTMRLDQMCAVWGLPAPQYVKLDTDGNELAVLEGFGELSAGVQQIMIETKDTIEKELADVLKGWGLEQRARFAERGGKPMYGMSYGWWVRPNGAA